MDSLGAAGQGANDTIDLDLSIPLNPTAAADKPPVDQDIAPKADTIQINKVEKEVINIDEDKDIKMTYEENKEPSDTFDQPKPLDVNTEDLMMQEAV